MPALFATDYAVAYYASVSEAPIEVLTTMYEFNNQLLREGKTNMKVFDGDEAVVVAYVPGKPKPVAMIVWDYDESEYWVWIAYVAPKHRRRGLFSKLWYEMVEVATAEGVKEIFASVADGNTEMRTAMTKMLRAKPEYTTYKYPV